MPPAARVGDLTVHGGTIVAGAATVFIEGMPAARQGDMHVCPMCNPGTPPPPHVGGPVAMGSTSVTIEGMPAARMGDMCICSGPPDTIAMGATSVIIGDGGNPVIIGGGGGITKIGGGGGMTIIGGGTASGGGGGGGGEGIGAQAAKYSAAAAQSLQPEATELHEPFLAAQIASSNAAPIAGVQRHLKDADGNEEQGVLPGNGQVLNGRLQSEGNSELSIRAIYGVRWSTETARVGDEVTITAQAPGFDDGTEAMVTIQQVTDQGPSDVEVLPPIDVRNGQIEATWTYGTRYGEPHAPTEVDTDRPAADQMPVYRAELLVVGALTTVHSGTLSYRDAIQVDFLDEQTEEPLPDARYQTYSTDGNRDGTADAQGRLDEDDLPAGRVDLDVDPGDAA